MKICIDKIPIGIPFVAYNPELNRTCRYVCVCDVIGFGLKVVNLSLNRVFTPLLVEIEATFIDDNTS
jgi:hypothetical protein